MLAAHDQENLVHSHQAAAAAKPLNHGAKQLQFRTPAAKAPKTPFKIPLNDENAPNTFNGKFQKSTVKGQAFQMANGKNGPAVDKNAFITPMGPSTRAPLGMKTTNAKAKTIQTPAGQALGTVNEKNQQRSTTSRKVKTRQPQIEVFKSTETGNLEDEEIPDIEYMPPRSKDIQDYPDDFLLNMDYSQLRGSNLTRGWYQTYCNPVGPDGLTKFQRQEKEAQARHEKEVDTMLRKAFDEMTFDLPEVQNNDICANQKIKTQSESSKRIPSSKGLQARQKTSRPLAKGPSSLRSKAAASALSYHNPASEASNPNQARPLIRAKVPTSIMGRSKQAPAPTNPSSMRHTAAKVTSQNTIGYTRGRATSVSLRANDSSESSKSKSIDATVSSEHQPLINHFEAHYSPEAGSDEWNKLRGYDTAEDEDEDIEDALKGRGNNFLYLDEDADKDFVLTL
ncbi:hypothetical protein L228DRAFT_243373 [Xylona heveae TC161]|uniref:Uncharacterized protein n=1 Tax=Xylona heveae (strain CBS 132557 / TC161) TaxID=1328760 RepID=A0A165K0F5_XYLHT|nr:hypothetical protein L228DRAFT_243373 [Xylona heveae TC161]KZF26848.1 hypothetical protein L228DRAFT_243373 [Xylona heveae TC161]